MFSSICAWTNGASKQSRRQWFVTPYYYVTVVLNQYAKKNIFQEQIHLKMPSTSGPFEQDSVCLAIVVSRKKLRTCMLAPLYHAGIVQFLLGYTPHVSCESVSRHPSPESNHVTWHIPNHTWASYQKHKMTGCACAGNAGNVFPPSTSKETAI